ncbi:hypothetical protein AB0J83_12045 [Actinoplanes sp. NPDC049596]|uniref:hypothetical protein n=1 Tax=unclassified Actinoplanes TaxID=2626549 RepID=UPI003416BD0C
MASPLAPLALWSPTPPDDLAERVADQIAANSKVEEQLVQIELVMLEGGSLAGQVLEELRRRGMNNNVLAQSEFGREIARESLDKGHFDLMRAALRARFGDLDDLDELARRLADRDHEENIGRIVAGATLAELRS